MHWIEFISHWGSLALAVVFIGVMVMALIRGET